MSSFYDVLNFVWPLITVFQLVVAAIAVQRLGSPGAKMMLVGAVLALFVSGYFFALNFFDLNGIYTGELEVEYVVTRMVSIGAQVIFLTGVLKIASMAVPDEETLMKHTEF